ncbi:MAG: ABC-2 type transport system ATP-binding protein [Parasphingorhabdus sp.]|jgi:ABC-2 type transport system ATP-binding protein
MTSVISIRNLNKVYANKYQALEDINLEIKKGEILALLGPNGAGKTTLISIVCGIVNASGGHVTVGGFDNKKDYRSARQQIGLVPQELTLGAFDTVWNTLCFSRGLFGKKPDSQYLSELLRKLSLEDKKDNLLMMLSGGMKRRVLIAKALAHQPEILFLDEPTAGVDVELRKEMWQIVDDLRATGVTIILTTHYIEEAEAIADRVGIMQQGRLLLVERKEALMQKLGKKQLDVELRAPIAEIPESLKTYTLEISADGHRLTYTYDIKSEQTGITSLLQDIRNAGLQLKDVHTRQSSLEDIFVNLLKRSA